MTISDPILDPYQIHFDGVQYTLLENCTSKDGKPYNITHGHYVDLTYAVKKVCNLEMSKENILSLKEFISEYKKLMERFKPLFYEN